jgi:hypothetical protein
MLPKLHNLELFGASKTSLLPFYSFFSFGMH